MHFFFVVGYFLGTPRSIRDYGGVACGPITYCIPFPVPLGRPLVPISCHPQLARRVTLSGTIPFEASATEQRCQGVALTRVADESPVRPPVTSARRASGAASAAASLVQECLPHPLSRLLSS